MSSRCDERSLLIRQEMGRRMKVMVTGAAGFIGANLCRVLVEDDSISQVTAVDDLSTGNRGNLSGLGLELMLGSVLDKDVLHAALQDADAVVHLAAIPSVSRSVEDPQASHEANATGTLRVLEAARCQPRPPHVIVASSSSVYGDNPELPKHEGMRCAPMSPYAVSKLATECYALAYARCFGLDVLALRFFNVFGPLQPAGHDYAAVVPAFVSAAVEGTPALVHGDGSQTRDFTFVETVAAVLVDALRRRVSHAGPVNLAFGTQTSLQELLSLIEKCVGHPVERRHTANRVGDVPHSQADNSLLRTLFPDVSPVPLPEGVAKTVDWFISP